MAGDASSAVTHRLQVTDQEDVDASVQTFVFIDEDHTLGNALRYMVMKNPDVAFCGYSIPHPSENKMNFRIQMKNGLSARGALRKGLLDLKSLSNHVLKTFDDSMTSYHSQS